MGTKNSNTLSLKVNMAFKRTIVVFFLFSLFYSFAQGETKKKDKEKTKIGKDVLDYTESDMYRLADQWDVSSYLNHFNFVNFY